MFNLLMSFSNRVLAPEIKILKREKIRQKNITKQKITILTQFYPPDFAATGQFINELATALVSEGQPVQIYTGKPGYAFSQADAPKEEYVDGVQVRRTNASKFLPKRIRGKLVNGIVFCVRSAIRLRNKTSRGSHLLITSAPPFLSLVGWLYNRLFGHSYTCLIYDIYPDVAVRLGITSQDSLIVKLWDALNLMVWKRAHSLIVLSEAMKQLLLEKDAELEDKIHVIHSWADADFIKPIPKEKNFFVQQHGVDKFFTVLYSGNLGHCHDAETIIQCARLLRNNPSIKFLFIGNGAGSLRVQEEINLGNLPNAMQLPYQDKEVLPYSLSAGDLSLVSVKPNMDSVVAPSKLYGILAAGRPVAVICPEGCYLRELIDEGNCGDYFANGDAQGLADYIERLASDRPEAEYLGRNARRYCEDRFTLEKILPQYLDALGLETISKPTTIYSRLT
jgi:glycosyltransferase involved in cell wall biosynthesis